MAKQAAVIEKLTEHIALINPKNYGRKSEKIDVDADQPDMLIENNMVT